MRSIVTLLVLPAAVLPMRAAAPAPPPPAPPKFAVTVTVRQHDGDAVQAQKQKETLCLRIRSTTGIGFCTITPRKEPWPERVVLLLENLNELESLTIRTGQRVAMGSRKQSGNFSLSKTGSDSESGEHKPEGTLNVTVERRKEGIVVRFPAKLLQGKTPVTIHWVDWFRR